MANSNCKYPMLASSPLTSKYLAVYLALLLLFLVIIMLRMWVLWNRHPSFVRWSIIGFAITQLATLAFMVQSAIQLQCMFLLLELS